MAYPSRVTLTEKERARLHTLTGFSIASARMLTCAGVLLKADHGEGVPGQSDAAVAGALDIYPSTLQRIR